MVSKHTPGPWQTLAEEFDRPYIRVRGTQVGWRYKIANVLTPVYEGVHSKEADETRANASLIAAAPDLLEALEAQLAVTDWSEQEKANELARAAIAKAEGRE